MEHFNKLTPAEAERLAFVLEEMGEVAQAIGKVLRHGYESRYQDGASNRERLTEEVGDLCLVLSLLIVELDLDGESVDAAIDSKGNRLRQYHHHQPEELFT